MSVIVVATLLVLILGTIVFSDALAGSGSMTTRQGLLDLIRLAVRSLRLSGNR